MKCQFHNDFYFGSATSAHQVEGNNTNSNWWQWECQKNTKNKDVSGKACDFWHLYRNDLNLAKKLNQNAFRFSIEWAKIKESNKHRINKSS
jgi:beta-glucosidase